jgi:hypothetical protein
MLWTALYKSLPRLTNLYRTESLPVVESFHQEVIDMKRSVIRQCMIAGVLVASAICAVASARQSELLALIPGDAQIIAGIEDPHNARVNGRLLFATHNNNLDFGDWMALVCADPDMGASKVVEVAASSARGELKEHLLIIEGSLNRDRIFRAAQQNGAKVVKYKGEEVLAISPFAREKRQMTETRWLAIIDGRISLFGTPLLVEQALDRRASHTLPDARLMEQLNQLHADVDSWNVLTMPPEVLARHLQAEQLDVSLKDVLDGIDELAIGVHYGSTARIDFAAHSVRDLEASGPAGWSQVQLLRVGQPRALRLRMENVAVDGNRAHGSIAVPAKQLDRWLAAIYTSRSAAVASR